MAGRVLTEQSAMEPNYLETFAKRGIGDPEIMFSEIQQRNTARGSSTEQR
jgi:hypothetical protein